MPTPPSDPQAEKEALYPAITHVHTPGDLRQRVQAVLALSDAVEQAEHVLAVLEPHQDTAEIGVQIHGDGLRTLLLWAQAELTQAERVALTCKNRYSISQTCQTEPGLPPQPINLFFQC
jgi:hypothetical protein